jgi:hypothetical protein
MIPLGKMFLSKSITFKEKEFLAEIARLEDRFAIMEETLERVGYLREDSYENQLMENIAIVQEALGRLRKDVSQ